jgi:hypothetical protein
MNIEAFLLCDAATDQIGKLNVLGAFDNIFVKQLPAIHPACAVAARIRFEKIEEGEHTVLILIIDEDGNSIGPKLEAKINVKLKEQMDSVVTNLILNILGLKFEKYGQYRIDLAIDSKIEASLPLHLTELPQKV